MRDIQRQWSAYCTAQQTVVAKGDPQRKLGRTMHRQQGNRTTCQCPFTHVNEHQGLP